jgi:hypothetical protein
MDKTVRRIGRLPKCYDGRSHRWLLKARTVGAGYEDWCRGCGAWYRDLIAERRASRFALAQEAGEEPTT